MLIIKKVFSFLFLLPTVYLMSQESIIYSPADNYVIDEDSIVFLWNRLDDLIHVQVAQDSSFLIWQDYYSVSLTQTRITIPISSGNSYFWKVKKVNSSIWSSIKKFTVIDIENLSNLNFWLDPSFGILESNNNINSWKEKVNNKEFSQTNANFQPNLSQKTLNNNNFVHFGKSNNTKTFLSSNSLYSTLDTNMTIVFNYNLEIANLVSFVLSQSTDVGMYVGATFQNRFLGIYDGNTNFWKTQSAPTQWAIGSINNRDLFYNGHELSPYSGSNATSIDAFSFDNIGSTHITGNVHFHGDLGEILIFNEVLSDSTRNLVEDYLKWKYTPIPNFGNDTVVCGAELTLKVPFDHGYSEINWSNGQTNVDSITVSTSGTYWVTVKSFGLELTDTINISLRDKPELSFENDTISCIENDLFLTYTNLGPFEYTWSNGSTVDTLFNLQSGTYFISQNDTASSCIISSDEIQITIDSFSLQSTLGPNRNFCLGSNLELQTTASNNEPYSYNWSTLDTSSFIVLNTPSDTLVGVTVTDAFGCVVNDTILATVLNLASPSVDFVSDTVCFGLPSHFISNSSASGTDNIINYEWKFPDNTFDNGNNTSQFVSLNNNTFNVNLTVFTDSNCQNSITKPVYINRLPVVNFNTEIVCEDNFYAFTESSFTFLPDIITNYSWYINNTIVSNIEDPDLMFMNQGINNLKLIVTSDFSCVDSLTKQIEVFPSLNADFSFSKNCLGDSVVFNDETASFSVVDWGWNFNNFGTSTLQNPKFIFDNVGNYPITLSIENAIGCKSEIIKNIEISPQPTASFQYDKACLNDNSIFYDNSILINDSIVKYSWQIDTSNYDGDSVSHLFNELSFYPVSLEIETQNACVDDTSQVVTVFDNPIPDFTFTPNYGTAPLEITFDNLSSGTNTYSWNFGDSVGVSSDESPTYTYLNNGVYNITLIASNSENCSAENVQEISIIPSDLDIELRNLDFDIIENADNSFSIKPTVEIKNVGTRNIQNADLVLNLNENSKFVQLWEDNISIGSAINYSFDGYYLVPNLNQSKYICVEAINVNDGTEINLENNKVCKLLEGIVQFSSPYPNPANGNIYLDVVTEEKGKCTIQIFDLEGKNILNSQDIELLKGYNKLNVNTSGYLSGKYILKIKYLDETYTKNFFKK